MDLSKIILDYADQRGQFSFRDICRYCRSQENCIDEVPEAAISACLRRLKGGGLIRNKRDYWYKLKQKRGPG